MYRHRLAAVFDPESLLLISDEYTEIFDNIPYALAGRTRWVRMDKREHHVDGCCRLADGERYDLAVVAVAQNKIQTVLGLLDNDTPRALIILTEQEVVQNPQILAEQVQQWAGEHDCQVFGPRSFGMQRPHKRLNLTRQPMSSPGKVAIISQSRTIQMAILDWAYSVRMGISAAVSLGEAQSASLSELLDFLAGDPQTESIVLFLDRFENGREFLSAMRMVASIKPLVILRAGRNNQELPGSDAVFDAAVRRAGAIRVRYFVELFSVLKTLTFAAQPRGGNLALVGTSQSVTQLLWDLVNVKSEMVKLAVIPEETADELVSVLGPGSRGDNPVVAYSPLHADRLIKALELLLKQKGVDAIMVIIAPDDSGRLPDLVQRLASFVPKSRKPILVTLFGEESMLPLRRVLDNAGTPAFRTPETAYSGLYSLMSYHYNQRLLQQVRIPLLRPPMRDLPRIRDIISAAREDQRTQLSFEESADILRAYGVDAHIDEAPNNDNPTRQYLPRLKIGVERDPVFGAWMYLTESGYRTIAPEDKGLELPPLNAYLATELILRSRIWRQELKNAVSDEIFRKLRNNLEFISELITDVADIDTLIIDPVQICDSDLYVHGIEIKLSEKAAAQNVYDYKHMAIYPYPAHLTQKRTFSDGRPWTVRAIRPEDANALQDFIRNLSEHSRYMRFVSMMTELTPKMLARYTYVDYYRELALVATVQEESESGDQSGAEKIIGFAHYLLNSDGIGAEYALVISDEWQKRGLGRSLMTQLLGEAKNQGLAYIEGFILSNNKPMLSLMTGLGLRNDPEPEDPMLRRVWMPFTEDFPHK